eukprot:TRINITY_DN3628_c0_g1_i2.p1 TRINITY_DN3628_c0_g1~~TRINITY_DN3628_c0_g1_i2.p1  ORF type:complete len:142 (-),score=31.27 TRINITY_DN3628_c0_g1_i2:6-431(-)
MIRRPPRSTHCISSAASDVYKRQIYNNVLSAIFMVPLILLSGEAHRLLEHPKVYESQTWIYMTVTGLFGYLINLSTFMQINYTSPLTHSISGTAKACVQTLLAIQIFKNPVTPMNAFGIFLTIAGSFWYSFIRYKEMSNKK